MSVGSPQIRHLTAVISPQAELADDVVVGPYCTIGEQVRIGSGCRLDSHVVVEGPITIGSDNRFFPFCSIGTQAQDLKYQGEETLLAIGSHNVFREYVNVNRGTSGGGGKTRIGDHGYFMVNAHVGHDSVLGDHVMLANAATLSGHVVIDNYGTIGAFSAVHQFCRVGIHGWVGGFTVVTKDVLPYSKTVTPRHTKAYGVNTMGLERRGFTPDQIAAIDAAFRLIQRSKLNTSQALDAIRDQIEGPEAQIIVEFIEKSTRGVHK
jgi:UDP-N-acetylglucosamine acyltransferase